MTLLGLYNLLKGDFSNGPKFPFGGFRGLSLRVFTTVRQLIHSNPKSTTMKPHLLILLCCLYWQSAIAQNALRFDGEDDWVELSLAGTPLANNDPDFTASTWFQNQDLSTNTNCLDNFRRLMTFARQFDARFEIGVCGDALTVWYNITTTNTRVSVATITPNNWHHLVVRKSNLDIEIYLDCVLVYSTTWDPDPTLNFTTFFLGHPWDNIVTPGEDWLGLVDEFQLYGAAVDPVALCNERYCPPSGNEANLFAYWTFDDPAIIPGGNNAAITQITDYSAGGVGTGTFGTQGNAFALSGTTSNFTNNNAPIVSPALHGLNLEIRDYPYRSNLLTGICDGEPVHICLDDAGQTPGPYGNVMVQWEMSDDGGTAWDPVSAPSFQDFCFPVQPAEIVANCSGNANGFVDRKYRAVSIVTGPTGEQCDYTSSEYDLQICCPITGANLTIVPSGPFCEGDMTDFQVDLNPLDPFVATPGPNVTIDWFFVGPNTQMGLPGFVNQTSFNYTNWTAPFPPGGVPGEYCFVAEVRNCQNKTAVFQQCVTVDPQPVCGTIAGSPLGSPLNLTQLSSSPLVYEICPGNDAKLEIDAPFLYCIPQWQYSLTNAPGSWVDMGLSGSIQNTNVLIGHHYPQGTGATSVFYRIQCNPLSNPSACDPCFSNVVEVQLKPVPAVPVVLIPAQVCLEATPKVASIQTVDPALTYTWFHDGLVVGNGASINVSETGCYWVEATDGCHLVVSDQECMEVCETIAIISCPLTPNECAELGEAFTLTAAGSENTCSGNTGSGLAYLWSDGSTTASITDTPPASGATYSVTVTDPATGCTAVAVRTVVPCDTDD